MTNCTRGSMKFSSINRKKVEGHFTGGSITSDGGLLLLREVDKRSGLSKRMSQAIQDKRNSSYVGHAIFDLLKQIFTSFNNPKGNADTERVMRTIKEDLVWIYEWDSSYSFEKAFKIWVENYNRDFPHMALGYKTPQQFADETLLIAA